MPNPHHRKKHKHFQPPPHVRKDEKKSAAPIIALFGAIIGLAITFFAAQATAPWLIAGAAIGGVLGYFAGKLMDNPAKRK